MIHTDVAHDRTELVAEHGIVTGGDIREAEAGVRMLQQGGNAVDAVVAAAFTGFVVEPANCGLGGYGRMSLFLAERGEYVTIDHYVRAPQQARADMFEVDPGQDVMYYGWPRVAGQRNEWGHLAPAVPGAVAGLCTAHERYGKLPLAQVLEPAISIAEAGLPVTAELVKHIAYRMDQLRALPHAAALLLRGGNLPQPGTSPDGGDRLDLSALGKTLRLIAQHGPAGFYAGPVAAAIERECGAHGGILTAADLAAYRPKILREKAASYRGHAYVTANDQVGYEALNILDCFDLARLGPDSVEFRHLVAEAFGCAFIDNMMHYGDPDFTRSPVNGLASRAFAALRAAGIRLDRAATRPITPGDPWPYESEADAPERMQATPSVGGLRGTSQMAAADQQGNMVTLITSLTNSFGSVVLVPDTGVFLNDAMQNFDPRPQQANCIAPGKMPIFAVPSVVATKDGRAVFGGCGSGGYRILSGVLHAMIHAIDFGMGIQAAVDAPRVHCQGQETYVDSRIPEAVQARLAAMGHTVVPQEGGVRATNFGRVNAIVVDPATNLFHAGTGPAPTTAAAGY